MSVFPIRNDDDHARALERVDALWGAEPHSEDGRTLEVLITLVDVYEREHHDVGPPEPIEAILFRMDQLGLKRKDLERYLGSRGRVSEVLSGKRALTLPMIRRLRAGLGIPAEVLIGGDEGDSAA